MLIFLTALFVNAVSGVLHPGGPTSRPLLGPGERVYDPAPAPAAAGLPFDTLVHRAFPEYAIRVKKSPMFCATTQTAYTGYVDIGTRHLFFTFVESHGEPANDDVVILVSGGPGGASENSLFNKDSIGPCMVTDDGSFVLNQYTWTKTTNMIFLDQPVGVGFSYSDTQETIDTTELAAKDVAVFLAVFFDHFSHYQKHTFHITGGSYAGRYIPLFATEILDQNSRLVDAGLPPIVIDSISIEDAFTDFAQLVAAGYDVGCTSSATTPFLDASTCTRMKQILPQCQSNITMFCQMDQSSSACVDTVAFCRNELTVPLQNSGRDTSNVEKPYCDWLDPICFPAQDHLIRFLGTADAQKSLGVDPGAETNFSLISMPVYESFVRTHDLESFTTHLHLESLLERGIRILYYNGKLDGVCHWLGVFKWLLALDWSGSDDFSAAQKRDWILDGSVTGWLKSTPSLTFVVVEGAGHNGEVDKPREVQTLLERWFANVTL